MFDNASITVGQAFDGQQDLILSGEVNIFAASQLHQEAVHLVESGQNVRVCCEHVASFDASALQVLVALSEALASQGRVLQFTGVPAELLDTFRLAGLAERLSLNRPAVESPPVDRHETPAAATASE